MAPQRRGALRAPEGSGASERRRPCSTKNVRAPWEVQRKWLRTTVLGACAVLTGLLLWSSLGGDDGVTEVLAHRGEILPGRFIEVPCSEDYDSHRRFEGCSPRKCGRGITDTVITRDEAQRIRSIAEKGLSLGGSDGGASILDLHSGALSVGKHFVNLYRYFGDKIQTVFSEEDFQLYRDVRQKVQLTIAQAFGISASSLHLTKPTFFSRINSTQARTAHDEYWHVHVDKPSVAPAAAGGLSSGLPAPPPCSSSSWEDLLTTPDPLDFPSLLCSRSVMLTSCRRSPSLPVLQPPHPPTPLHTHGLGMLPGETCLGRHPRAAMCSGDPGHPSCP
ncbi:2-oxoglutarate and iron-dependent oxygenase domain-containing protein 3 isoform X1 [Panthera pardus]|uniref:2-oxoglutarate and iron-dependent oxygenase domain-containing protein 3 isoform X1 n=1 Tax=Panthera pardus TaxID=9691 RepID=A0A9V1GFV6_PANPR|nr:2-oxoglutarate and iron-dependent oxygenase domain-containing protein 3 isoform X1 [Panthera pardus]